MVVQIDALRRKDPDLPSRQEVIRRILTTHFESTAEGIDREKD
jgi:hypothetical protein